MTNNPPEQVESPCNNICNLDANEVCIGCHRTIQEITLWPTMSNQQKKAVLKEVTQRTQAAED